MSFLVSPGAPTPAAGDSSTKLATTAFVTGAVAAVTGSGGGSVTSVAGRTGAVTLGVGDVAGAAPLASPALTGIPTAPTAPAGTNSAQLATTSFVAASFVTYAFASATYATAANATLTGTPTAPTPAQGDNSTKLATTAYADRAAAALITRTQVVDAAYAVQPSDRTVAVTALTAGRILTLPAASAYPQGATLTIVDESGACSATSTLTLARAGTDTINGAAGAAIASPYGYLALQSNGSNKWTVIDQAIAPAALATVAQGPAGSQIQFGVLEQLVTLSGASTTSTVQIPNRAIVFAVSSRTVTAGHGRTLIRRRRVGQCHAVRRIAGHRGGLEQLGDHRAHGLLQPDAGRDHRHERQFHGRRRPHRHPIRPVQRPDLLTLRPPRLRLAPAPRPRRGTPPHVGERAMPRTRATPREAPACPALRAGHPAISRHSEHRT